MIFEELSDGQLYARTSDKTNTVEQTWIPGDWSTLFHTFRIDWTASVVKYWVDGALKATHYRSVTDPLKLVAYDQVTSDGPLRVDWVRVSPYSASGTFESHVFGTAGSSKTWDSVSWTATVPSGTGLAMYVRTGNTATPDDGTWTDWVPVAASGAPFQATSQRIQYRAVLSRDSDTPTLAVTLEDVTLRYL
jgi:hypothetical protein